MTPHCSFTRMKKKTKKNVRGKIGNLFSKLLNRLIFGRHHQSIALILEQHFVSHSVRKQFFLFFGYRALKLETSTDDDLLDNAK